MANRYSPRKMEFQSLVDTLVAEHATMRKGLGQAKEAAARHDYPGVQRALRDIDPVFRQHIADEEAQVLGLLIRTLGVKGAEAEIQVFRQHRPIYQLMQKVGELAGMSAGELESKQAELDALFEAHTKAEEERVFPKAKAMNEQN